jgi:hypothetical protein
MNPSSLRRGDIDQGAIREAAAYPLPFTAGKIKTLDKMVEKRRGALRLLVLLGVAGLLILAWVFGDCLIAGSPPDHVRRVVG